MMLIERVHTHVIVPNTNVLGMTYILAKTFPGCKNFFQLSGKIFATICLPSGELIACGYIYYMIQRLACSVTAQIFPADIPNEGFCSVVMTKADAGDMGCQ